MIRLSEKQIIKMHNSLIKEFGGESGIRDINMLDLALNSPFQTFDGEDLYVGDLKKITHLGYSIIKNHPFIDGNKRIGLHAMLILFNINGYSLKYSQEELISIIFDVASSNKSEKELLDWIILHLK